MRGQPSQNTVAVFWYVGQYYLISRQPSQFWGIYSKKTPFLAKFNLSCTAFHEL